MKTLKKKEHENLTPENIHRVISLLTPTGTEKPITKKEACEILNIAYNTTRLQKIIDDYNDHKDYIELRKSQNRGKAASQQEIAEAVTEYIRGESIAEIARGLYRSSGFVKSILDRVGVPQRPASIEESSGFDYIPEECVAESFSEGEVVWSARHHTTAIIEREISVDYQAEKDGFKDVNYEKKYSSKCYSIWVLEEIDDDKEMWARVSTGGFSAFALAYDIGKLTHLETYGVDLSRL